VPLVRAAIIPAAPLLVPGMSATLPDNVAEVCRAMDDALTRLATAECAVLVAVADKPGVYDHAEASLAGFGRPDLATCLRVASWQPEAPRRQGPLPPGLAVLALLLGDRAPVVPISVNARATAHCLAASGAAIASSLPGQGVLLAAGDLSAGLGERSPRFQVEGAAAWDKAVVAAVDAQRPEQLAALGPAEAHRVAALSWAPIVVAQAACIAAGLRLRVSHYSAPRGVGYLVARTETDA
jgi:hypothetical protein